MEVLISLPLEVPSKLLSQFLMVSSIAVFHFNFQENTFLFLRNMDILEQISPLESASSQYESFHSNLENNISRVGLVWYLDFLNSNLNEPGSSAWPAPYLTKPSDQDL